MKFSIVAAAVFAASVSASGLSARDDATLPPCALKCATSSDSDKCGGNGATASLSCLCQDNDWLSAVQTCVLTDCSGDDLSAAVTVATSQCQAAIAGGDSTTISSTSATESSSGSSSRSSSGSSSSASKSASKSASASSTATTSTTGSGSKNAAIALAAVVVGAALI